MFAVADRSMPPASGRSEGSGPVAAPPPTYITIGSPQMSAARAGRRTKLVVAEPVFSSSAALLGWVLDRIIFLNVVKSLTRETWMM